MRAYFVARRESSPKIQKRLDSVERLVLRNIFSKSQRVVDELLSFLWQVYEGMGQCRSQVFEKSTYSHRRRIPNLLCSSKAPKLTMESFQEAGEKPWVLRRHWCWVGFECHENLSERCKSFLERESFQLPLTGRHGHNFQVPLRWSCETLTPIQ